MLKGACWVGRPSEYLVIGAWRSLEETSRGWRLGRKGNLTGKGMREMERKMLSERNAVRE